MQNFLRYTQTQKELLGNLHISLMPLRDDSERQVSWLENNMNTHKMPSGLFFKTETLAQVFSCEFWEISKNIFFYRTLLVAASGFYYIRQKLFKQNIFLPITFISLQVHGFRNVINLIASVMRLIFKLLWGITEI